MHYTELEVMKIKIIKCEQGADYKGYILGDEDLYSILTRIILLI